MLMEVKVKKTCILLEPNFDQPCTEAGGHCLVFVEKQGLSSSDMAWNEMTFFVFCCGK